MNKEFREWLESELWHFNNTVYTDNRELAVQKELEFVIERYDELHKPVVIPKFVAEYLEKAKKEINLLRVFEIANGLNELDVWRKEYNWIRLYHIDFARAWLDGYEVEEEPKYNVRVPHTPQVYYRKELFGSSISTVLTKEDDENIIFTEQEIKELLPDIPKKYWEEVK